MNETEACWYPPVISTLRRLRLKDYDWFGLPSSSNGGGVGRRHRKSRPGIVSHTCNHGTQEEAKERGSRVQAVRGWLAM